MGRYRDDNEIDEANFEFEGYDIELTAVGFEHYRAKPTSFVAPSLLRLNKALMLASRAHKYQRRKYDKSPYLNHLLEVQDLLVNTAQVRDEDIIIGGLLHDVIEDADVTKTDLLNEFGNLGNLGVRFFENASILKSRSRGFSPL
ncbi:HD domain-containing protein [Glaciecola siphonariae]|uniref:HD domain-containing protein n=1 Tax=Glaciecola siphonariae TaxID=521012 RepID=A0ABV9LYW9_9ALTE